MSNQNVELGNAWQLIRKKRIISIVTLPHWSKVDRDMRMQADFRLWCRKGRSVPRPIARRACASTDSEDRQGHVPQDDGPGNTDCTDCGEGVPGG